MKKIISLFFSIVCLGATAQLNQVILEEYYNPDDGPLVDGYPEDHITYRMYALLEDPDDFVYTIFAVSGCHSLHINAESQFYNNAEGGVLGEHINLGACIANPSLCYDSFATIGRQHNLSPGNQVGIIASCPGASPWSYSFSASYSGQNLYVCDGNVYTDPGDQNGFPVGGDNRVLLFQFTIPDTVQLTYKINLSILDGGVLENEMRYVWDTESLGCGSPNEVDGSQLGLIGNIFGCDDPNAFNYDPNLPPGGECIYPGCTDPNACNYDPSSPTDDGSCVYETTILGIVYGDINDNENYDNTFLYEESGLFAQQVLINETGEILFTDIDGHFEINMPAGTTYTLTLLDSDNLFDPLPESLNFVISASDICENIEVDLGMSTESDIVALALYTGAFNSYIHCDNGMTAGVTIYNLGNVTFSGTITMTFDPTLSAEIIPGVVAPSQINIGEVIWNFEDQGPAQTFFYACHILGPGVNFIGDEFDFEMNVVFLDENDVEVYALSWNNASLVQCGYDPNDKQAEPIGYAEPHYILPDDEIEYRIRFQNTGNAPAENVVIADSLDINTLDINTFTPLYSSHNFMTSLGSDGLVHFTFNEINLPDSASDPAGSEGFVIYRIKPRTDISLNSVINNTALIYFDQNPPIITNTTWHTIYDCSELELLDGSTSEICESGNTSINIDYPYVESLEWSINDEEAGMGNILELNGLEPDNYTISLVASNPLCAATSEAFILVHEAPQVSFTDSDAILTANEGFVSYQWYIDGEMIEGAEEQIYTAEISGEYSVLVTDYYGCSSFSEAIYVLVNSIDQAQLQALALYPNPMADYAIIQFATESNTRFVRLLDLQGKEITGPELASSSVYYLKRNGLPAGAYLVEINDGNNFQRINLILE